MELLQDFNVINLISRILDKLFDLSWLIQHKKPKQHALMSKWLPVLIVVGIFGYLIYKSFLGLSQVLSQGIHFNFGYLFISLICQVFGLSIAVYVWGDILKKLGITSTYIYNYEVYCVSAIARKIPGGIWYAFTRMIAYSYLKNRNGSHSLL